MTKEGIISENRGRCPELETIKHPGLNQRRTANRFETDSRGGTGGPFLVLNQHAQELVGRRGINKCRPMTKRGQRISTFALLRHADYHVGWIYQEGKFARGQKPHSSTTCKTVAIYSSC